MINSKFLFWIGAPTLIFGMIAGSDHMVAMSQIHLVGAMICELIEKKDSK